MIKKGDILENIKKSYVDYIESHIIENNIKQDNNGNVIVSSVMIPILDHLNDFVEVFVLEKPSGYLLTDNGNTSTEIAMSGLGIPFPHIQMIVRKYGMVLDKDSKALKMGPVSEDKLGHAINMFSQCVAAISIYAYIENKIQKK